MAALALVASALLGCGARSALFSHDGGEEGGFGGASAASATSGATTGSAGGAASCPVASFAGDREGGVRLELDATHAYWTTTTGLVQRGELATGTFETLASAASATVAIAPSGEVVYFADSSRLARVPKGGGEVEVLAEGAFAPMDLAVRGETVYLLDRGSGLFSGRVLVWTAEQGLVVLVDFLSLPRALAVDESDLYVIAQGILLGDAVIDAPLLRIGRAGVPIDVLESGQREAFGVELDADEIYWGVGVNDRFSLEPRLFAAPKGRGDKRLVAVFEPTLPVAFVLDEAFAYVTLPFFPTGQTPYSQLVRVALAGGEPELLEERPSEFFTEPAESGSYVAWSVQRNVDDAGDFDDVRVLCKP